MTARNTASLLTHLTLAAAGLCLAVASMPLLPEMPFVLVGYLLLLSWSWRRGRRWALPAWAANLLALAIAVGATGYVGLRVSGSTAFEWSKDMPAQVALIPLIGPWLMALVLVRLFRSRAPQDVLQLHGIALLQVALGCVLAGGTLFGLLLLGYFVLALCGLSANEARRQRRDAAAPPVAVDGGGSLVNWLGFGLGWLAVALLLAVPLFWLAPRLDGPGWEPLSRLASRRPAAATARTGFSDEIDLRRSSVLVPDNQVAFTVKKMDRSGHPQGGLPAGQRWRGLVIDRYENGLWRGELSWPSASPLFRPAPLPPGEDLALLEFHIPGRAGSLFLAEPVLPGARPGELPLVADRRWQKEPLFFEAGGTGLPTTYLPRRDYRYTQQVAPNQDLTRYRAVRVLDRYQERLLRHDVPGMEEFTLDLLLRLTDEGPLRQALRERHPARAGAGRPPRLEPLPPASWERLCRLLTDHLASSGAFTYDLTSGRSDSDLDPSLDFLRNVRRGSCERYASALTLMLRSVGVPARIVKGYRGWDYQGDGTYHVRQRDAHAWVEALVPAAGDGPLRWDWLLLDPTPASEEPAGSALARWLQQQQQSGQTLWQEMILGYGPGRRSTLWQGLSAAVLSRTGLAVLLAAAGAPLVGLVYHLRRSRRRDRGRRPASLVARLRAALVPALGLPADPAQTPAELAALARPGLAGRPATAALADLPDRVVALYYRERFGGEPAAAAEVAALSAEVDRLAAALRRRPR